MAKWKQIMQQNDIYTKKKLGQNFLKENNVIKRIIELVNIDEKTAVIEIGPGIGALTDEIIKNCKKTIAFEIDNQLVMFLQEKYKDKNIEILNADILKVDLDQIIEKQFLEFEKIIIISNLPYYISTPILFKIFSINNKKISKLIFMLQKEVGERITAKKDSNNYNNLTVVTSFYSDPRIILKVSRNNFIPIPKVDSVVLEFLMNKKYHIENEEDFLIFIRTIFQNKRKTILNNIATYFKKNKLEIKQKLNDINIDENNRPQNLSLENYFEIYKKLMI